MTRTRSISTATASAVAVAIAALAAPAALAHAPVPPPPAKNLRDVCVKSAYVKLRPGTVVAGTVYRGESVEVTQRSKSGGYVYVVGSRPRFIVKGWVPTRYLCAPGKRAEFAKTSRYSVRIVNSPAGGDPGFLYVGGPANITVKDTKRAGQALTMCVTPAPIDRPSCRNGRTGHTIDSVAWSAAVTTEVRITIAGGPVLVDTVRPYAINAPKASH